MRTCVILLVIGVLTACAAAQPSLVTPQAVPTVQATSAAISPVAALAIDVSTPQLKPVGDRLEWTEATYTLAVRNSTDEARNVEVIVWYTVQPPGLHGPGWGERSAYQRVQVQAGPQTRTATEVTIREVHADSSVTIDRSYVRQIDGQVIDSRPLDAAFEE